MQKKDQSLDMLQKRVSVNLNKSPEDLDPFFKILKDNWYDSQQALLKLTLDDYQKMRIPHRVAQVLIQELTKRPDNAKTKKQPQQSNSNVEKAQNKSALNQQRMTKMVLKLTQRLLSKFNNNFNQVRAVLQVLYKVVSNIVKDPYELKFRTLKKTNNLIQNNIIKHQMCLQFIQLLGFEDNGQNLQLNTFQVPHLIFLQECLDEAIIRSGGAKQKKQKNHPVQQNMFLDIKKFPNNQQNLKEQFSEQKLAEVKYIDALQHLVQIRNKMMSEAPKNRRLRIYHKRWQAKNVNISTISFQEQFQKSNDQNIATYWKQIIENNKKAQSFQSKRKLEFQYLIKQKIHKETLIKVKLPNQLIIEAYFGPLEKLQEVFKLVANIVIGDLYLFTAPPKKIMDAKQLDKTLIGIDAVPMGSFYLGARNQIFYIQKQYIQSIQQ